MEKDRDREHLWRWNYRDHYGHCLVVVSKTTQWERENLQELRWRWHYPETPSTTSTTKSRVLFTCHPFLHHPLLLLAKFGKPSSYSSCYPSPCDVRSIKQTVTTVVHVTLSFPSLFWLSSPLRSLPPLSDQSLFPFVYYESRKWEVRRRLVNEGRCDERLKPKVEESTCLTYTGLHDKQTLVVYYEPLKRALKTKTIYGYRCDERLKTNIKESTRLAILHCGGTGTPLLFIMNRKSES